MIVAPGAVVLGVKDADLTGNLAAMKFAIRESSRRGASIAVVHGSAPRLRLLPTTGAVESEQHERGRTTVSQVAEQLRRLSRMGVQVDVVPVDTSGVDALLDGSASASMVVLPARHSTHGRGIAGPGSTIRAVAARAACPVVVVAQQQGERSHHGIVVGVEEHGRAQGALLTALRVGARDHLPVTAVHAWDVAMGDPSSGAVPPTPGEVAVARATARLVMAEALAGLAPDFPTVDLRTRLPRGPVVDALRESAGHADLLVIGRHTESRLGFHALGPTAAALLDTAACPVMVVAPSGPYRGSIRKRLAAEVPTGTGY